MEFEGEMMEMTEALMYADDSICVKYSDGSSLQLSPCGSVFSYQGTTARPHMTQQLTRFAISMYKEKVCEAVTLRNRFACRAYLCKGFLPQKQIMVAYKTVKQCTWPAQDTQDFVKKLPDGTIQVRSLDEYARLTLMAHKQMFIVNFLAEVDVPLPVRHVQLPFQELNNGASSAASVTSQRKRLYTWVEQMHSVKHCPPCWRHPLQLVLSVDEVTVPHPTGTSCVTDLPLSLPLNCGDTHLHNWKAQVINNGCSEDAFWQSNLKIMWRNGIIYRIHRDKLFSLDVLVNDGSFISSQGPSGTFFTHSFWDSSSEKVEERVYSASRPPPDKPGQTFSVAKVVKTAARILEFVSRVGTSTESAPHTCCWNRASVSSDKEIFRSSTELLESCVITNLAKFTAYSSGHIHITFADRAILTMKSPRRTKKEGNTDLPLNKSAHTNVCQLILPNGSVRTVPLDTPNEFERYTQLALQWLEWINSNPENRKSFCEGTIWDPNYQRTAQAEIEKIQRFNYIMENCASSRTFRSFMGDTCPVDKENKTDLCPPMSPNHDSSLSVHDALQRTAKAIQDIELLLSSKPSSSETVSL